ncbi:MAG: hypothetical protein K5864_04060 [Bacteroidales bacterium]|nr:hypothetical protein [Bacteroidales bacterium]
MKKLTSIIFAVVLLAACTNNEEQLKKRAEVLCRYIPDHELSTQSEEYMTADFYNVLDTMFNYLPEIEAMDHEWLYYFVTGNGGTIADFTVNGVELIDKTHAVATISVRQKWEDGSFDPDTDVEEHKLAMEKVDGEWLIADFDGHKADCIRHITIARDEQAQRDAIKDYLIKEIGPQYQQGELCIPTLLVVASELADSDYVPMLCDCWVFWYNIAGDTLKCVSGGNHSGLISLNGMNGQYRVTSFEQTVDGADNVASAKRIFGSHYDIYENVHASERLRETVRNMQLKEYVKRHNLDVHYYQDYGWPAVEIEK